MIEPDLGERAKYLVRDADGGGDEIGVENGRMGRRRDVDEIAPGAGLAAGQVHLQYTERRRLTKDARPGRGVELVISNVERQGIRAIGAAERTAVGELGEQAERFVQGC